MLRQLKIIFCVGLLVFGCHSGWAYSEIGPVNEAYQDPSIGYNPNINYYDGLSSAPKNLNEEYRRNTPVLYYSFDQNFLEYFGSEGVVALDGAFGVINFAFTNNPDGVSKGLLGYSVDLSEIPLRVKQENYLASALGLYDLKSLVISGMMEQLGLAQAERYVWVLHARNLPAGGTCPASMQYTVVKRNFDPVTFEPTSYVNGTLYSYAITEYCTAQASPAPPLLADADEISVDPLAFAFTSVAFNELNLGEYLTGLTRDDIGGLRYLYRTNNVNFESVGPGATLYTLTTNTTGGGQLLTTLDLGPFLNSLPTTDPNTLLGQYPNLDITSVVTNYVLITQTNIITGSNTLPWLPAGFGAIAVSQSVPTNLFAQRYTYTFGNIVTNHIYTNWSTVTRTLTITPKPFAPAGSGLIATNTTSVSVKGVGGDFYILPPGISGYLFQPGLVITNKGTTTTTTTLTTDSAGNAVTQQQIVTPFTNYSYIVYTIQLQADTSTNAAAFLQGIGKITFVRRDFDSLIGTFFQPITNTYSMNALVNNALASRTVKRVVGRPDFLFTSRDMDSGPGGTITSSAYTRNLNFNQNNVLPGLAGPGTIETPTTISLNKDYPLFVNSGSALTEQLGSFLLYYASFDGTTNPPVVYPSGTSLANLENQILMHVTSTTLPDGTRNVAYNGGSGFQLTGSGGSPPYTWTVVGNALPAGLVLSSEGIISGTPTGGTATFDFTVRMTDIGGTRSIDQSLQITIH